jgi:hypothetical protein
VVCKEAWTKSLSIASSSVKDVSASSNLLPVKEFFFNVFGFGLVGGNLRINLLLVYEIVGKSRVALRRTSEMPGLADDVFSAVAEIF